ncbi:MAG: CBS domain-containing protein [Nitrososphaerales archaeon]
MRRIQDVMHSPVVSIDVEKSVYEAAVLMEHHKIGSIVALEGDRPVGILTERDFVGLIAKEKVSASSLKVVNLMTKAPITIRADSTVDEAGELMTRQGIRRLLVVERNKLVGIVTNRDILLTLLEGLGYESMYA